MSIPRDTCQGKIANVNVECYNGAHAIPFTYSGHAHMITAALKYKVWQNNNRLYIVLYYMNTTRLSKLVAKKLILYRLYYKKENLYIRVHVYCFIINVIRIEIL